MIVSSESDFLNPGITENPRLGNINHPLPPEEAEKKLVIGIDVTVVHKALTHAKGKRRLVAGDVVGTNLAEEAGTLYNL